MQTPNNRQTEIKEQRQRRRTAVRRRRCAVALLLLLPLLVLDGYVHVCRGPDTVRRVRAFWDLGSGWQLYCSVMLGSQIKTRNNNRKQKTTKTSGHARGSPGDVMWVQQRVRAAVETDGRTQTTGDVRHCCGTRGCRCRKVQCSGKQTCLVSNNILKTPENKPEKDDKTPKKI